jgi:hypothetical protein
MLLTMREKTRIEAVQAIIDRLLTIAQAATTSNLSEQEEAMRFAAPAFAQLINSVQITYPTHPTAQ